MSALSRRRTIRIFALASSRSQRADALSIQQPPDGLSSPFHFFSDATPPAARRRRIVFVVILIVASAAIVWPVYVPFGGIRPFVLGLPLSMAWVAFWIIAMFAAMVWLYRSEED